MQSKQANKINDDFKLYTDFSMNFKKVNIVTSTSALDSISSGLQGLQAASGDVRWESIGPFLKIPFESISTTISFLGQLCRFCCVNVKSNIWCFLGW